MNLQAPDTPVDAQFIQKVQANPYYAALWHATQDPKMLLYAGFFDDLLAQPAKTQDWFKLSLPLASYRQIEQRYWDSLATEVPTPETVSNRVVLVCTGAFSPAHAGHLAMMTQAREHCERLGWTVLGGFFSPSHDLYVNQKSNGAAKRDAAVRIAALNDLLLQHSPHAGWLGVHPWESLYAPCPLNFTDVLDRVEHELFQYVAPHGDAPIQLVYVFGSDNQGFIHAFTSGATPNRIGLCVGRDEPEKFSLPSFPAISLPYLWQVSGAPATARISSTGMRSQFDWAPYETPLNSQGLHGCPLYIVRDDLEESLPPGLIGRVPDGALNAFLAGLLDCLRRALPDDLELQTVPVLPAQWANNFNGDGTVLVLDKPLGSLIQSGRVHWPRAHVANVSRVFELSGMQAAPLYLSSNLIEVLACFGAEKITTILDDDQGSGRTSAWVLSEVERLGFKTPDFQFTLDAILNEQSINVFDVVDARDFLLGFKASGLVVELEGNSKRLGRAPYWSPFVNLATRAKLKPARQKSFTSDVLELNRAFFNTCSSFSNTDCKISDLEEPSQLFLSYCGFAKSDSVLDVLQSFTRQLS